MGRQSLNEILLSLECPDRPGIVHAVAGFLLHHGCNIVDSQQFGDSRTGRFFLRIRAESVQPVDLPSLEVSFAGLADKFGMLWRLEDVRLRTRVLIMVSTADHCLNELFDLWRNDLAPIEIVGVVSNHDVLRGVVEREGVTFHHVPVRTENKPITDRALLSLVEETGTDLVVLARYMQILGNEVCERLRNRVINIHHSFLPGFKGARPYHQAYERGVKAIGATAHYVTADLDEGPIIQQSVVSVDHRAAPEDLVVAGRRAERMALAQAVTWHAERRVFVDGLRTIVFD